MPANLNDVIEIANSYNLYVIEDCAQAHGAQFFDGHIWQSVGSVGDINAWSFCQDKIMSLGGEGGFVSSNNAELMERNWVSKVMEK